MERTIEPRSTESDSSSLLVHQIRELAALSGVTQKELAHHLGIKPSHINLFFKEKSDVHSKKLIEILSCLGINICDILDSKIRELKRDSVKKDSLCLYSKLVHLDDYNREPLLNIVKTLVG